MSTVTMTNSAGMRSQGWRATLAIICESCNSVPQLTAGGWIPSPMKLKLVSPMIMPGTDSVIATTI